MDFLWWGLFGSIIINPGEKKSINHVIIFVSLFRSEIKRLINGLKLSILLKLCSFKSDDWLSVTVRDLRCLHQVFIQNYLNVSLSQVSATPQSGHNEDISNRGIKYGFTPKSRQTSSVLPNFLYSNKRGKKTLKFIH